MARAPKTHKTAVVWIPPEPLWEPIQHLRRQYDRQIHRWMPHITLLYPFLPSPQLAAAAATLRSVLRSFAPFTTLLHQFRFFQHNRFTFTLWLLPEPVHRWQALEAQLVAAFPAYTEQMHYPGGFTPHLSIGQFRGSRTELLHFCEQLQQTWQPLSASVKTIAIIQRDDPPNDQFRVYATIPLGDAE